MTVQTRYASLVLLLTAVGCGGPEAAPVGNGSEADMERPVATEPAPAPAPKAVTAPRPVPSTETPTAWDVAASGEGAALYLADKSGGGKRALTFFCPAGSGELVVNVPAFRPIGSEERMSFGAGATAVALVADSRGDRLRGGVSGKGPLPAELEQVLSGPAPISVSYGAQQAGPHAPPPAALVDNFLAGCRG